MDQEPTCVASDSDFESDGELSAGQKPSTWPPAPDNSRRCRFCVGLTISGLFQLAQEYSKTSVFSPWGNKPYEHHASLEDLEQSAELGCDFCHFMIECTKKARFHETEFREGGVSVDDHLVVEEYWEYMGKSLYATAKEMNKLSPIRLAIFNGMSPSSSSAMNKPRVYETLWVKVGELPSINLNITVSRGKRIYFDGVQIGRHSLIRELGSPVNLGIAKGWLDDCRDNHTICCPVGGSRLPTRVLDIGTSEGLSHCRLIETDSKEGCYVALSHCWGGEIPERLTKETRPAFLSSIQIANLPANFRDAIYVTRQLNLQYLWIDALCIVQDSKEDWAAESAKMDSIYQDAALTIFAAASKGSRQGFLKTAIQPQPTPTTLRVFMNPDIQTSVLVTGREVKEESFYDMESRSELAYRGWAYQESCLSRRSLYFGARQLYWECFEAVDNLEELMPALISHESKMVLPDASGKLEKSDAKAARSQFYKVVSGYTNDKALTRSEDKLPAFSGLAKRFHPFFGGEYLAGLWSEDFSSGLLWPRAFSALSSSYTAVEPYRAPSWSWASDDGWIRYFVIPSQTFLELHGWDIQPRSRHNPYGEIDPGGESARPSVTVSGQTMLFIRRKDIDDNGDRPYFGTVEFDVLEGPEEMVAHSTDSNHRQIRLSIVDDAKIESYIYRQDWLEDDEDVPDSPSESSDEYLALAVGADPNIVWGLVLRKSGDAFQRVGLWMIETDSGEIWSWKGWEKRFLKLI